MRTAIIISIGSKQLKEQGYRRILKSFEYVNLVGAAWYYKMSHTPDARTQGTLIKCFITIGGRVRWIADVVGFLSENRTIRFEHGAFTGKWLLLSNFKKVLIQVNLKGFQGFRYVKEGSELANYYNL